jgi:hypothetical protein
MTFKENTNVQNENTQLKDTVVYKSYSYDEQRI